MTFQDMLNAAMYGQGQGFGSAPNMPTQQPVPFSSSPPANAMKRAFNFITNPPAGATPAPADTGSIQPLGSVKNLLPALMAGSGASQATPQNSAAAMPVPKPQDGSPVTAPPGPPMNIVPPGASVGAGAMGGYNPGLSAVSGAAEGNGGIPQSSPGGGVPLFGFMNKLGSSATQSTPTGAVNQQQGGQGDQGILPKLIKDMGALKALFAAGAA